MGYRTIYYDDTNPKVEAENIGVEFMIDGVVHEIDLSNDNLAKLRAAFAPYVDKARRQPRGGTGNVVKFAASTTPRRRPSADREQLKAMREWAHKTGLKCGEKGRVPRAVQEAYHNRDVRTGKPAANETAPRVDGATSSATGGNKEARNAATMEEFKELFRPWAENLGYKINKNGLSAPPVVKKFSTETGIYPPNVELKAG